MKTTDRRQSQMESLPIVATAPGKAILFGEHAVVYGRPAIAVPLTDVHATATITASEPGSGIHVLAADLPAPDGRPGGHRYRAYDAPEDDPLRAIVEAALDVFLQDTNAIEPDLLITVTSTIPIARGLGSGAAVATAVARALARYAGYPPQPDEISRLVYQVEKLHHGTPSGIDNTVIAYEQPVFFIRGEKMTRLSVNAPLNLIIADTGVISSTLEVVGDVRRRWQAQPDLYESLFDEIGAISRLAQSAIERGDPRAVGQLMDDNQERLVTLGVSSPELDALIATAHASGALGAKLSGAGWGGNMLALIETPDASVIAQALRDAGAISTILSPIS
jgi:mevalonate kinase